MKRNSELRAEARATLSINWLLAVVVTLVYGAVASATAWIPFLVTLPILYGYDIVFLKARRANQAVEIGDLFDGFHDYGRVLFTNLLVAVYTFLWTLLFVIPGIVKMFSYSMTNFILADRPELSYNAAIEESMRIMRGNKMKLFLLYLSFIGWAILCIFTFGIGYLFLQPYVQASKVAFYEDLKAQA